MKDKYKLNKFLIFIAGQIIVSSIIITVLQVAFSLRTAIIISHLFVICSINLLMVSFGLLLFSKRFFNYQKITKYIISSLYAILFALLYYVYVFTFLGQYLNSKAFNLQIVLNSLKYTNEYIRNLALNPILVYTVLVIMPLLIIITTLLMTKFIHQGIAHFSKFTFGDTFNNPVKNRKLSVATLSLMIGYISGIVLLAHSPISNRAFIGNEPIIFFFFTNKDPFEVKAIRSNKEGIKIRNEYPKNLEFEKKNVIIIIVDALRSDHLSLFGYGRKTSPFLDSLYSTNQLKKIESSFSVSASSFAGINGILRSKIWSNITYDDFSLQQLLKDQGYSVNFLLSGDHTNFYGLKSFLGKGSDINYYIDGTNHYLNPNNDEIIIEGLKNINEYNNSPSFLHFHLMSVHKLGVKADKYKVFQPANAGAFDIENYTNNYDNGILQADNYIKEIFQTLETKGYLQNSIVVITADHGEALGERGEFGHVKNVYTDQILIPILIYDTDSVEYKNTQYATSLDIAPTIVDRLDLPIPEIWEGSSLFTQENIAFSFHQWREDYAIVHNNGNTRLKYVFNNNTKKEELFELNTDLYETKNIIDSIDIRYIDTIRNQLIQFGLEL